MYSLLTDSPKPLPDAFSNPEDLRPFAKVRLIAFDLDGTLIGHPSYALGPRLTKLIHTVSSSNVTVTLATGRTLAGVRAALGELRGLSRVPLVLYNGSVVMRPKEEALIDHRDISALTAKQIIELSTICTGVSAFIYCINPVAKMNGDSAETETVYFAAKDITAPSTDFNGMVVHPVAELDLETAKVVAILIETPGAEVRASILASLHTLLGISVTVSGQKYLELRPAGSSKAVGLGKLCDQLGISANAVLAVGDNDNDIELLSWAGISVSVRQASTGALQASKFYSSHGAGNAAIEILEIVRRAQRLFKKDKTT